MQITQRKCSAKTSLEFNNPTHHCKMPNQMVSLTPAKISGFKKSCIHAEEKKEIYRHD
jgi:hypothetical protein